MTPYMLVYGEIRRVVPGEPPENWPLILHDHGGSLSDCCIPAVLDELNHLAAECEAAEERIADLRKQLEAKP